MTYSRHLSLAVSFRGLLVAALAAAATGLAMAHGEGVMGLAVVGLAWLYCLIGIRWQRGIYWLMVYLPFAGAVTLALYPSTLPLLFKDLLFVVPAYLAFFVRWGLRRESLRGLPKGPVGLMMALALLVVAQMANPGVENVLMALIGLKVWLFYLPLFFLSYAFVASARDLSGLLRLLVGLSFIPSSIGIAEALLVQGIGYEPVMDAIYGEAALQATQAFAGFELEEGMLVRIPSTFTFVTQYFSYTLAMLAPCYAVWRGDPSPGWRRVGLWSLIVVTLASFLSGARAAFVLVPLLLASTFALDRGVSGVIRSGLYAVGLLAGALAILGISGFALYEQLSELGVSYSHEIAYSGLIQALVSAPGGSGTGTNTGPARYAFADPESLVAIENYYAKAAYELGVPGLLVVVGLFASLIVQGWRSHPRLRHASLRSCSAGLLAFLLMLVLSSVKGWMIDLDPVNVYLWIFAGVLMKLPALDSTIDKRCGIVAGPVPSPDAAASAGLSVHETKRKA